MASTQEESPTSTEKIEIDVLVLIRRRWPHLFLGVLAGAVIAAVYFFSTTPVYESQIEILVGQRSSEVTNNGTITGAGASGDAIHEDQLATHMRLFVGRKLIADAIDIDGLDQLESFQQAAAAGVSPIDHVLENIDVQRGGEGSASEAMVLRATFRDPNPNDAALVLAAIYESYRSYVESHGQTSTKEAVQLIEDARQTHESELAAADREYRNFVRSVPVLVDGEKLQDLHKDRLMNLEAELNTVRNMLAESTSRLEIIQSRRIHHNQPGISTKIDHLALLSQNEVARLKLFLDVTHGETQSKEFQAEEPARIEVAKLQYNRLLELIQKERSLSEAFGPGHPMVEAVRQEAEIARQFIADNGPKAEETRPITKLDPEEMLKTYTMLLRNDIAELKKREELLVAQSANELSLAKQVEADFMMGNSLKARLTRAQARYDQVILRLQELRLARSYAGFSTDVLANPEPAKSPAWPNLPIVGAIGCCLGFALGLVLAVCAELLDTTFKNVKELEEIVGAPAIAHVPRFAQSDFADQIDPDSAIDLSLVSHHVPRAAESEVYRVARTSLMVASRKGSVQTMMMSSPQPGDGKSTTISNLAISFAGAGKKVLLIDADMRRPVISKLFGIDEPVGLADVLQGEANMEDAIVASEVAGLDIMPNGAPTSEPAELLESQRLAKLLHAVKQEYDLVLIDAPPLLAVADPAIIAPSVDSVILTVRIAKNGRRPVEHAARILHDIDVQPAAVIVNGVNGDAKSYYGYGSYAADPYGYIGQYHADYGVADSEAELNRAAKEKTRQRPRRQSSVPAPAMLDTDSRLSSDVTVSR